MFLIGMKEPAMHCRARRLRETLKIQSRAVTVLASHVRTFLQKKRFVEMKRRQYAATKIQAVFRGYQQRVLYKVKQAEALEREKKQKQIEDFAQLVQRHKDALEPFPRKGPERRVLEGEELAKERRSRLEAAMKMREIYEEKQRWWEAFRAAEGQRRVDKARREELDRLTKIMEESRGRREYTRSKFRQTLSVRSHHHAATVIQRAFREMKTRRWWQEKARARRELEKIWRENRAAVKIQRAWRRYRQRKIYQSTHFKSVLTSPVVALPEQVLGRSPRWSYEGPSYKRSISITGNPRRKMHQTLQGGFRVPRHYFQTLHTQPPPSCLLHPFPTRPKEGRSSTSPALVLSSTLGSRMNAADEQALPELFSRVSILTKTKPPSTSATTKHAPFRLPQIVPH
jgi:hypothetical protein